MMTRKTTRIDLHIHTKGSDGWGRPEDILRYAQRAKLDGLCLTDHHRTYTAESLEVARTLRAAGLLAFHGCEYSTAQGHLLVYGVNVELFDWGFYPDPQRVIREVKAAGGVCIPAHPYKGYKRRYGDDVKKLKGIAGIETANGQCTFQNPHANKQAAAMAVAAGLVTFGGSDAHNPAHIGLCYTQFGAVIETEKDLLKAMKQGAAHAVTAKKLVQSELCRRRKTCRIKPAPSYDLLPGLSLDSPVKSVQIPLDGEWESQWDRDFDPDKH
jgi:predicted metal-dependent phosphoesterase TrpH